MDNFTDFEAGRAAIMNLPHLIALKAEHELKIADALDRASVEILQEAFKLGFEAGVASTEQKP